MPPLGLLTIASYLPEDFSVRLVKTSLREIWDRASRRSIATSRRNRKPIGDWADVVFLSVMMAQREDYRECIANAKMRGKPVAVGGPFTHALPETPCGGMGRNSWRCC
jgi:hypothetical protein